MKFALPTLIAVAVATLGACATHSGSTSTASTGDDTSTAVVLIPNAGASEALQSGCWATFYDDRNFNGDSLTMIGPVELQSLDKGSARQLKRDLRSVVTGPRANLELYEHQLLSSRAVGFSPGSREGSLVEKLGFGGRVESMRLLCTSQ
jgi:hypothetical protein